MATFATTLISGPVFVGQNINASAKTSTYTIVPGDSTIRADATSGAVTVNLPTAASIVGAVYTVKKIDSTSNAVNVVAAGANKIDGQGTQSLYAQYTAITAQSDGTNWNVI